MINSHLFFGIYVFKSSFQADQHERGLLNLTKFLKFNGFFENKIFPIIFFTSIYQYNQNNKLTKGNYGLLIQ
jgi:hypothetical protein